jgi:CubicO group peptidase (beta-lactamase class C family)
LTDPIPSVIQVLNGVKPTNTPTVFVDKLSGADFRYSGGGYTVLQQMLMDIEDKDYQNIMSEKVLSPLDIKISEWNWL